LVEALDHLLAQPSLRVECGERARKQAFANYSLSRIRDRYEELYHALLAEKGWLPGPERCSSKASSRPARVAIVAPSSRWIGGQGVQASLLIRHWQNDPEVEVRFIPHDPKLPRAMAWIEQIRYLRTVARIPFYLAALWRAIGDADVVHIFSGAYWSFMLAPVPAWLVACWRGKKTLINYHSGEARDHLRRWPTALPVLRRVDGLVVPSNYLVNVFREFDLEAKAVPNLVDPTQFSYRPRRPLRPILVCTRGFGPYYGMDVVVRAFAQLKRKSPAAHLCLVGSGAQEREVRDLVDGLKLADVRFAGPVSHQEIGRFYDQADIFINASWLDNMPVSILEAFASGTPVGSTAPEGMGHIVQHENTGLLCAPGDWRALAENAGRLLRDPDLASRLALNAYEQSRRYRWEVVREQWLEVYNSLRQVREGRRNSTSRPLAEKGVLP
jgi:glycosyltransferase involved in cell wall biosynthesis